MNLLKKIHAGKETGKEYFIYFHKRNSMKPLKSDAYFLLKMILDPCIGSNFHIVCSDNIKLLDNTCELIIIDDACYSGQQIVDEIEEIRKINDLGLSLHVVLGAHTVNGIQNITRTCRYINISSNDQSVISVYSDLNSNIRKTDRIVHTKAKEWINQHNQHNEVYTILPKNRDPVLQDTYSLMTPDYKIVDEVSSFTALFAYLVKGIKPPDYKQIKYGALQKYCGGSSLDIIINKIFN